jgi:Saxitoxin biosynthesis operon protein SxtJ
MAIAPSIVPPVELRKFGLLSGAIVAVLFGLLIPWLANLGFVRWPWYLASGLVAWGLIWPKGLIFVYRPWLKFGHIAGWINTRIILLLLFYLVFFPVGLVMKLVAKDPMRRKKEETITYRVISSVRHRHHMEKPY